MYFGFMTSIRVRILEVHRCNARSQTVAIAHEPRQRFGGERKEIPKAEHRWLVLGYDLQSGRELWRQEAHRGTPPTQLHMKNTFKGNLSGSLATAWDQ